MSGSIPSSVLLLRAYSYDLVNKRPLYVFDGKPPTLKSGELAKRTARKFEAKEAAEEAKEVGTAEDIEKFSRRTVRVTREHNEECKRLLKLMGVPYMDAPCEAEAQCAELARGGKVRFSRHLKFSLC